MPNFMVNAYMEVLKPKVPKWRSQYHSFKIERTPSRVSLPL